MLLKPKSVYFAILSIPLLVVSCASKPSVIPIDQRSTICDTISQDIIMNDNVTNPPSPPNGLPYTPATDAALYKEYDFYHCDEVKIHNGSGPIRPTR